MKRIDFILLAVVMLSLLAACSAPAARQPETQQETQLGTRQETQLSVQAGPAPADEYERAVWYGFAQYQEDADREISQKEFADMLSIMAGVYRPGAAEEFLDSAMVQEANDNAVYRFHAAVLLLCAAEAMDCASLPNGGYPTFNADTADWAAFWALDANAIGKAEDDFPFCRSMTEAWIYDADPLSYLYGGVNFAVSRLSLANGRPLLDLDGEAYMRNMDLLTYREAAAAAVRLYESNSEIAAQLPEDDAAAAVVQAAFEKARARRDKIIHSKTEVNYTGTAYYISNSGNDSANGLTPETAWTSISRLNEQPLIPGDAVFFERGGTWRGEMIDTRKGVTYSAYGEGAKPRLLGSPENGADPTKWTLLDGTDNIWVYHRDMLDCGAVVLDEKRGALKVLGYWDGTKYLNYLGPDNRTIGDRFTLEQQLAEPAFDVKEQLDRDLTFFSEASSDLPDTTVSYLGGAAATGEQIIYVTSGPLYFRCDAGNPGDVYDSIEFIVSKHVIDALRGDCVLDNLFFGYTMGISMNEPGAVVQNCELAWLGGHVVSYGFEDFDANPRGALRVGGGLNTGSVNIVMQNNYLHEIYEEAFGVEAFRGRLEGGDRSAENIFISGNLTYHAGSGFCYFNWDQEADPDHMFKNVVYEDNYILFTGFSDWSSRNNAAASGIDGGPNLQEGCAFRKNLFLGSRDDIVYINQLHPDTLPDFEGNEYIQFLSCPLLWLNELNTKYGMEDAESVIRDTLGDESGTYTVLHSMKWDKEYIKK